MFLPHPRHKPKFPSCKKIIHAQQKKLVINSFSHIFFHIVKGSHPMNVRPSINSPSQNILKSLVGY